MTGIKTEFSIIITCYNEELSVDEFISRLLKTMRETGRAFEVIMVNDGSADKTFGRLRDLIDKNQEITHIVDLFRNAGQIAAMSCGITKASGEYYIFLDSDLQLFPEELPLLIDKIGEGYDIVSGVRKSRSEGVARKLPSFIANLMMQKVAGHKISDFGCTFKIYNAKLIKAFEFGPHKAWKTAFVFAKAEKVIEVPVTQVERKYGKSGWSFKKLANFLFDHVVGLSTRPFLTLSIISLIIGMIFFLRLIASFFISGGLLPTVTNGFILNSIVLTMFVTLCGFSAIGEFVFRVFLRTEQDPIYIEKFHISREQGSLREE